MRKAHKNNYNKLAKFLQSKGYSVEKLYHEKYEFSKIFKSGYTSYGITGKNIKGMFCTPNNDSYRCLSGFICADHVDCFDKWSKCPISMRVENIDYNLLISQLEYLGSEQGLEDSNTFEYAKFVYEFRKDK